MTIQGRRASTPRSLVAVRPENVPIFFLQMFVILATCRFFGWLVRRWLRQPQVIGEMIAGVVLGPSLLGLLAPEIQAFLFPPESKAVLYVVAQLGIGLYMFLVGLDFRSDDFRANAPSAVAVSISGIVVPFLVAIAGTPFLMSVPGLFTADVSQFNATLFLGAAIAITAFPVLARIIQERGLSGSLIATLSLSAAAIGDAVAWCVLAVVLASLGAGPAVAVIAIVGGIALSAVLIFLGPRLFAPLGRLAEREHAAGQPLSTTVLAAALMLFTLSAWFADFIGLHAVFGGFLIGTAMPRGVFAASAQATARTIHAGIPAAGVLHVFGPQHATHDGEHRAAAAHRARHTRGIHLRQVRCVLGGGARSPAWTIAARSESVRS